jgi:dTDP-4-dehydrorhamnose reductase
MNVLVIGKNGQIGRYLNNYLGSKEYNVICTDRSDLEIVDRENVHRIFNYFCPDIVINVAAYTDVKQSEITPINASSVNSDAVGNIVQGCKAVGASLIHVSTDYVFDGATTKAYTEDDRPNPVNQYGRSKYEGEQIIAESGINYIILRTSWVFSEFNSNFLKTMLLNAEQSTVLRVVGDQFGNPTFAGDVAEAIALMVFSLEREVQSIYHFCGGPLCSWHEFAVEIFDVAREKKIISREVNVQAVKTSEYESLVTRPLFTSLDCSKFEMDFKVKMPRWKDSLERLLHRWPRST